MGGPFFVENVQRFQWLQILVGNLGQVEFRIRRLQKE